MLYQIYEVTENQELEFLFESECDDKQECIDEYIGMFDLFDKEDITDECERTIMKLLDGDYEVQSDPVFADIRYIIVSTK